MTAPPRSVTTGWPDEARPERSPVYARSEILISAPATDVFAWLIHAQRWPQWYSQCGSVRILLGPGPTLAVGTRFRWTVLGIPVETIVEECEAPHRLAWSGTGLGASAYHSWDIEPTREGCRAITEETQRGVLPTLAQFGLRPLLRYTQTRWLAALARVAIWGPPPVA